MTKISIPTKIDIPDNIEVRLVREDILETSNIFRIFFEIFLALFGGVFGVFLTSPKFEFNHWFLFASLLVLTGVFLFFTYRYNGKARVQEVSTETKLDNFPFKIMGLLANIRNEEIKKVTKILTNLQIPNQNIKWHSNTIKTEYTTLKISELNKDLLIKVIEFFKNEKVDFIDEKIII